MDEKLAHTEGLSFGNRVLMADMALVGALHPLVDSTRSLLPGWDTARGAGACTMKSSTCHSFLPPGIKCGVTNLC